MNSVLVATNLISALFILVISLGLLQLPKEVLGSTRRFRDCLWIAFIGLFLEMFAYLLNGRADMSFLILISNYLCIILIDLITIIYAFYLHDLISESKQNFRKLFAYVITAICVVDIVVMTVGVFSGKIFTVKGGYYTEGPWSSLQALLPGLCLLIMIVLYIFRFKYFRIQSPLFVVLIVLVPTIATVFVRLNPDVRYGFTGVALSLAVIYEVIETRIIAEELAEAMMFNNISVTDHLTGLKNRRGYQEVMDGLRKEENLGIAFIDINSLKAVNDDQGHQAGDELIVKVANIITQAVPDGHVCRISGDEFVCIVEGSDKEAFEKSMSTLRDIFNDNDRVAAMGYDFGIGSNYLEIQKSAEKMMYADKEDYYKQTGKDRRH